MEEEVNSLEQDHFITINNNLEEFGTNHVKLNIGGQIFETTWDTLCQEPESMFASMFSGTFDVQTDYNGAYFIDRDGTHFRYILNYLRTGKLIFPNENRVLKEELLMEAQFYQITGIELALWRSNANFYNSPSIISSLTAEQKVALRSFVPTPQNFHWNLLFFVRDGWKPGHFHSFCDNKGPTVVLATVCMLEKQYVFGGYTQESWMSKKTSLPASFKFVNDKNAFLFTLANATGVEPTKIVQQTEPEVSAGTWCHSNHGPAFGTASGMTIVFMDKENARTCSVNDTCGGFQCPGKQQLSSFLGFRSAQVKNLEVFGLQES